MATTTKSKTTRTSKKSAPAAKTPKTTKTVKVEKKTEVTPVKAVVTPFDRLRSVHISMFAAFAVFAALIAAFVSTAATALTLGIQDKNDFSSLDHTVLGSASEVLYNIDPRYVLITSLVMSALGAILLATKLRSRYETTVASRTSAFRWAITGLSAAILITFVNLLAGVNDFATIKLSAAFILVTAALALLAERENVGVARPKWFAYILSLFTGAIAWLPIISTFIGTSLYGKEHFGWEVYAIAAATLLGFSSLAINQYRHLKAGIAADYAAVEARYLNIDLLTKFAVVLIALIALK